MSDFITTPNLGLYKPTYDADDEQWGNHLNANADKLDAVISSIPGGSTGGFLPTAGGTMTGPLNFATTGAGGLQRAAQDRAADVANVLDFGADKTGAADSTAAFLAAIATGHNVYIPAGSYIIRNQLTTAATGQEIFGDGRGLTTLLIDQTFSPSAACVISLTGREQYSPTIRDLTINFAQPSDQASRANFLTLAAGGTSGTGGTGVKYPPAIGITSSNRFKLRNLKIARAWDGIITVGANTIGGFFIRDIEMCAFNVGLAINNVFDFPHLIGYHFWTFDLSAALVGVYRDGNTIGATFGPNFGLCNCTDWSVYQGRVQISGQYTSMDFVGLHMDGNNATMEISDTTQTTICNGYFSGSPTGANPMTAQLNVMGGNVFVSNIYWQTNLLQSVFQSGGKLWINGGEMLHSGSGNDPVINQTGGRSYITGLSINVPFSAAWTVPVVNVSGGVTSFHANTFVENAPGAGNVGGLVIAVDHPYNAVSGNFWNGWNWTPPGTLGSYGFNDDGVAMEMVYLRAGATTGSATSTTGAGINLQSAAGHQRAMVFYSASSIRWAVAVNGTTEGGSDVGSDFTVNRYHDAGTLIDIPFQITRSSGITNITNLAIGTNAGPTIRSGAGAAAGTQPKGAVWMRTDGAVGSTLYVSQGGGTWNAVAGV